MSRQTKADLAHARACAWNRVHPVGTRVRVRGVLSKAIRRGVFRTESEAFVTLWRNPAVRVEGLGPVYLGFVEPFQKELRS